MPTNPFDLLKQFALRKVPGAQPPTEIQEENRDFRAQAIQDAEPTGLRSTGRNAIDAITGFLVDDPFAEPSASVQKGITKPSAAAWGGQLAAAAPLGIPKRLPVIAPEAYRDVKAGGLRLYSRLTDAFAKAPKQMNPDKIRSIAKQGASAEEVSLRKLEDFLAGRQPMDKVAREDVMSHLAANPLELDVVRKGKGNLTEDPHLLDPNYINARDAFNRYQHELDTRQDIGPNVFEDELQRRFPTEHAELVRLHREMETARGNARVADEPRYDWLQTPGPKENYGETLINWTSPEEKALRQQMGQARGQMETTYKQSAEGSPYQLPEPRWDEYGAASTEYHNAKRDADALSFQSSHWDEPNNLVWTRHNERRLFPPSPVDGISPQNLTLEEGWQPGPKGWFTEEIQSDWHQQGREMGYKGDPIDEWIDRTVKHSDPRANIPDEYETFIRKDAPIYQGQAALGYTPDEAKARLQAQFDQMRPPDAPFKDTYHELAIKADLLDAANRDDLEWYGIADADTVSAMEGHTSVRPGTELYYNQKHPSVLEKLLSPLGGKVEPANLPSPPSSTGVYTGSRQDAPANPLGSFPVMVDNVHVASSLPPPSGSLMGANRLEDRIKAKVDQGWRPPGPGFWKAPLPPELKELIKTRGFPAMAALLALQQSLIPRQEPD